MFKVLLKKQLSEVFRNYYYNPKKNTMRSKVAVALYFLFFLVLMVGFLGGVFTFLSLSICDTLAQEEMGWFYFLLLGGTAIALGTFGSVFNTYTSLYLAKDNDLLFSLPIPAGTIMTARLVNVYLMGTMYAATVLIPALAVYWVVTGITAAKVICGLLFFLIVTILVLLLSCLLGWVVAKISIRLKNRSFISVLISLLFIGAYYFFYFRANNLIGEIILNAKVYGGRIKGAAYGLYLFGRAGEGGWLAAGICTAVTAVLFAAILLLMRRSFLRIATLSGTTGKVRYTEKAVRQKGVSAALIGKELARFTSNANYMLNCGLGILLIPASGVLLLIKGGELCGMLNMVLASRPGSAAILVCAMLCLVSSMNDMVVPSVSLEGKSLWLLRSLPVDPGQVLLAKAKAQLLLTEIPMLFAAVCAAVIVPGSPAEKVMLCVTPLLFVLFLTLYGLAIGVRMPLLSWTNEIAPIKQSGAVGIFMFSSWAFSAALAGLYLLIGYRIGPAAFMLICAVLFAGASLFLLRWVKTTGSRIFAELS